MLVQIHKSKLCYRFFRKFAMKIQSQGSNIFSSRHCSTNVGCIYEEQQSVGDSYPDTWKGNYVVYIPVEIIQDNQNSLVNSVYVNVICDKN